jgi:hypothetical protein
MTIQEMNPTAQALFNPSGLCVKGQHLSMFMDIKEFVAVWRTQMPVLTKWTRHEDLDVITRQTIFPLKDYGMVVGVFTDVTDEERRREKINDMKDKAISKANRVIREQMKVAQDIAGLLGETTASTKATLLELVSLIQQEDGEA